LVAIVVVLLVKFCVMIVVSIHVSTPSIAENVITPVLMVSSVLVVLVFSLAQNQLLKFVLAVVAI